MRNSIIVNVRELRSLVQDARRTGKEYVELSILDPLDDGDECIPASLSICAFDSSECIELDEIYAPENESELSDSMDHAIHMSSDLF